MSPTGEWDETIEVALRKLEEARQAELTNSNETAGEGSEQTGGLTKPRAPQREEEAAQQDRRKTAMAPDQLNSTKEEDEPQQVEAKLKTEGSKSILLMAQRRLVTMGSSHSSVAIPLQGKIVGKQVFHLLQQSFALGSQHW